MKTIEIPSRKEQGRKAEFPWQVARRIHEALFPQSAEFYRNAERGTVALFALASLKSWVEAPNLQSALVPQLQLYEALLYLN